MVDREKVLKGLECCLVQTEEVPPLCEECPYCDEKIGSCEYFRDILSDALALLKSDQAEIQSLNRELDAMNRLSEMQMEALQEAEHDRTD